MRPERPRRSPDASGRRTPFARGPAPRSHVRAPCRSSGRARASPRAPLRTSGRPIPGPRARRRSRSRLPWAGQGSARARPRTFPGIPRSRRSRCAPRAVAWRRPAKGRRSSRRPGLSRDSRARRPPGRAGTGCSSIRRSQAPIRRTCRFTIPLQGALGGGGGIRTHG